MSGPPEYVEDINVEAHQGGEAWSPSWWNEYRDEVAESVLRGPGYHFMPRHEALSPILLGNMIRGGRMEVENANIISQRTWFFEKGMRSENKPLITGGNVFEHISGKNPNAAISESEDGKYGVDGRVRAFENVYRKNHFELRNTDAPRASFSNRSNSFIADNQYLTDRDNRYRVGEDSYMHGKIIPLYRTVRITDEERAVVSVVNAGAVAMEWTVEADEPWIIVERDSGGSLVPEALDSFYVYVEDDLRSADVQSGRIRLLAGSSTLVIGVDVLSRSENPAHTRLSFSFYLCA